MGYRSIIDGCDRNRDRGGGGIQSTIIDPEGETVAAIEIGGGCVGEIRRRSGQSAMHGAGHQEIAQGRFLEVGAVQGEGERSVFGGA